MQASTTKLVHALVLLAAQASALAPGRLNHLPERVDDWAVEPTCSSWRGVELCCLTASSDPDVDGLLSVAHPEHPQFRAVNELGDPHGALGVWPSAYAAAAELGARAPAPRRVLELGAGAGLPSLFASVVLGAAVRATDVETVPLAFLAAARGAHAPPPTDFSTAYLDVIEAETDDLAWADVVVAADLLYNADVAAALGERLGRYVAPGRDVVVCDPGRRGRESFLDAFRRFRDAEFVDVDVPGGVADVFDGSPQPTVGVLRYDT